MCCDRPVSDNRPEHLRALAEALAVEAAAFVRGRRAEIFGQRPGDSSDPANAVQAVRVKSTPTDPVTVVDTETESLLRSRLAAQRPGDAVLGEEGGGPQTGSGDGVCWVLDPIDGTVNFVYGLPAYAVSVAAQIGGQSVAGAVADVVSGDVYSAAQGGGAQVLRAGSRRALSCSTVTELPMSLVGTGFGYAAGRRAEQAALLARMLPVVRDVRRIGSASLDLCLVAEGRLDAYYEHGLHVWDWAAAALVAVEAGALVRLPEPAEGDGALVVAAAPGVFTPLVETLEGFGGLRALP